VFIVHGDGVQGRLADVQDSGDEHAVAALQVSLHTRKGLAPVLCFSAQCTAANQEARRRGADDFAQELIVRSEAYVCCGSSLHPFVQRSKIIANIPVISNGWYAKLKLHHALPLEIHELYFCPVVCAAHCGEYQIWVSLLSVNLWRHVNISTAVLLDIYV
jgi:hypothetical protein